MGRSTDWGRDRCRGGEGARVCFWGGRGLGVASDPAARVRFVSVVRGDRRRRCR